MANKIQKDIYDGLLAHPNYEFKHLDRVTYDYQDSGDTKTQFCELVFIPDVSAFMLVNFTDETFQKVKEGKDSSNFLYEVGIDLLELHVDNPY
ncbi:hypothetical protein [Sphingobacterium yanglingense]|uniref:Uncharacterized protein n=1 Tax=Sphingobacterium yanglingense TaxID=1437280 RepID=A0A4V3DE32_9SPHI|nr:hypothetical protein [Sphingobacterium yanglingense]TDQ79539.1 hypothetical protein CLV99_0982 [Sphingobacterium yanglingense]